MNRKELTKLISSFVIGDGALSNLKHYGKGKGSYEINKKKNSKYYIKKLAVHRDYIEWQASILEELTSVTINTNPEHVDKRGYACKEQLELYTRCHPFYTTMRENFYMGGRKIINPHYLKLWDAQSMAILFMDDGWLEKTLNKNGSIYYRLGISTHSFTYGDNVLLKNMIKEKFSIEFDVKSHKQKSGEYKYYLRNTKDNSLRFIGLISKYIFPSFQYKIDLFVQPTPQMGEDIV